MTPSIAGQRASRRALFLAGVSGVMALALPTVAHGAAQNTQPAQSDEAPPAPPPAQVEANGNEILVTATKREQTLQNVPVAVTVTTADVLDRAKIRDIKDLASVVPSLRVVDHQNSTTTSFLIRGFGNGDNNVGVEPSVGVFIDGVYRSRSAAQIADLPDVSRVEVLRGPQSTLFGKNASAGVVSLTTAEPSFKRKQSIEVSYGNYNALVIKSMISGKLSDHVAASFASGYNRRDGYVTDGAAGGATNNRKRGFLRGQLMYVGDTGLKIRLIGDYGSINENCCASVNIKPSASTQAIQALGGKVNSPSDPYSTVYNNFPSVNQVVNYGGSAQVDYAVGPVKLTSITALRKTINHSNQDSDFTSADLLSRNSADIYIKTFTQELRANVAFGDVLNLLAGGYYFNEKINQNGQLLYGSQFRNYADLLIQGQSGGAFTLPAVETLLGALSGNPALYSGKFFQNGTGLNETYGLKNEALSLFGQFDVKVGEKLTLTGGLNYTHDTKRFNVGAVSTDTFSGLALSNYVTPATQLFTAQGVATALGNPGGIATAAQIGAFATNPATAAIYQTIAGRAGATAQQLLGLRALQFMPPFLNVPNAVEPGHTSDSNVSYTARIAYQAARHLNFYASYATGYKASSINLSRDSRPALSDAAAIAASGLTVANLRYGSRFALPEKSAVMEFGMKANWGIATANVAVFKQNIKNFQTNLFTGTGFDLLNADKESVFGIEFEGTVHVSPELTLGESVTYLRPKYDSFTNSSFGDVSGATPAGISQLVSTFVGTWDHGLANGDHLILRGDWHYEAPTQIEDGLPGFITRNPLTGAVVSYQTGIDAARPYRREVSEVDGSITYKMTNGLEFSVWGRNLTNNRYLTVIFDSPAQTGSISAYPNQPRTYGVAALWKF